MGGGRGGGGGGGGGQGREPGGWGGGGPMFSCQKLVEFFFSWCLPYNLQPRHGRARQDLSRRDTTCICFGKVEEGVFNPTAHGSCFGGTAFFHDFFNSDENFYP